MTSTIFAAATARARSAVAIVRLSGPATAATVAQLAGTLPQPRRATLRRLQHRGSVIDEALVLWFPAPRSFTGEDAAELQVHGGLAILDAVAAALTDLGLVPAAPGEFTRRALENSRLDLAQAEGLADLIDAETEAQRRQALEQLGGALGRRHEEWRSLLVQASASLEAAVDFPDEDLPQDVANAASQPLRLLIEGVEAALAAPPAGEVVREGFRVALVGAPNAGKSSLLNALVGHDAAIVTPVPGTTRDVVERPIVLEGFKVLLADTAGLRASADVVEAEGVRRAETWARSAHLRLWVHAPDDAPCRPSVVGDDDLAVLTKVDLGARQRVDELTSLPVSVVSGSGLPELRQHIARRVAAAAPSTFPAITRLRHRLALSETLDHLRRSVAGLLVPELAAEDLRLASRALAGVTGVVAAEDVLDAVFREFCIGK